MNFKGVLRLPRTVTATAVEIDKELTEAIFLTLRCESDFACEVIDTTFHPLFIFIIIRVPEVVVTSR